jgi:hypothetical protein
VCLAHVGDPDLAAALHMEAIGGPPIEFFTLPGRGADLLLEEHAPGLDGEGPPPHLVVVGDDPLGRAVVLEAARRWWANPFREGRRLSIDVIGLLDDDPAERWPPLTESTDLRLIPDDGPPGRVAAAHVVSERPDLVVVCTGGDSRSVTVGLRVARSAPSVPVVVELQESPGLAALLGEGGEPADLRPFPLYERVLAAPLLLGGVMEALAEAIHRSFVAARRAEGRADHPSAVPWADLPEHLRESNRAQADDIPEKLDLVGCRMGPLTDWAKAANPFTRDEIDRLAKREHDRWMQEKEAAGWSHGEPRDDEAKKHPDLVPWERLGPEARAKDREAVEQIPVLLARLGYQVWRQ